jgi:hypothetical protein
MKNLFLSLLFCGLIFAANVNAQTYEWHIGSPNAADVTAIFDPATGTLTISGTGAMQNFTLGNTPWWSQNSNIKTVIIENGVTTIGDLAFFEAALTSVNIPGSVTTIGAGAFLSSRALTSVNIPNSVTTIRNSAFERASALTSVNIPNSVTSIENNTFREATALTSVTIPNSVTTIGNGAFMSTALTSVNIPNSVTTIGNWAFATTALTSVNIPAGVSSIGDWAFAGCTNLQTVFNLSSNPQAINSNVFQNVNLASASLYVPSDAIELYEQAAVWSNFGTIKTIEESDNAEVLAEYFRNLANALRERVSVLEMLLEELKDELEELREDLEKCLAGTTTRVDTRQAISVQLHPNPAQNFVYIQADFVITKIEIFNSSGVRVLAGTSGIRPSETHRIDLQGFTEGVYFVRIHNSEGGTMTRKLVVSP